MSTIDRRTLLCGKSLNLDLLKLKCSYIKWFEMRNTGKPKSTLYNIMRQHSLCHQQGSIWKFTQIDKTKAVCLLKKNNENNKIDKNIKEKQIMASVIYLGRQLQTKSTIVLDLTIIADQCQKCLNKMREPKLASLKKKGAIHT